MALFKIRVGSYRVKGKGKLSLVRILTPDLGIYLGSCDLKVNAFNVYYN